MQRLDPSSWNLASLAAGALPWTIAALGCGPVVGIQGETDTDDPTQPTDPSDPSSPSDPSFPTDPSNPSDPSDPTVPNQCDAYNPCPYGYVCNDGLCEPDYYCLDFCCGGDDGCCYYDDGCNYYDFCNYDTDCRAGQYCGEFNECAPAHTPVQCQADVFAQLIPVTLGGEVLSLAFLDGNGDAARELAVGLVGGAQVVPGGNAAAPVALDVAPDLDVPSIAVGDLDGDGDLDLLLAHTGGASVAAHHGDGLGGFVLGVGPDAVASRVGAGDFDGDGVVDVVGMFDVGAPSEVLAILRGAGGGTYEPPYAHDTAGETADFDVAPLFGGPGDDLVGYDLDTIAIWRSGPLDGTADQLVWGGGYQPGSVAVGDVDGDGALDLVRAVAYGGGTMVRVFAASVGFAPAAHAYVPGAYDTVGAGDLDGDGRADVYLGGGDADFVVLRAPGGPGECIASYPTFGPTRVHAFGDFTGDGLVDLAQADGVEVHVYSTQL